MPKDSQAWLYELLDIRVQDKVRLPNALRLLDDAIHDISKMLGVSDDTHQTEVR